MFAVNEMQGLNDGGFATPVVCVIIADTEALVAPSGCHNFKCINPLAHMCWLCGCDRSHCLGLVVQGSSLVLKA